MICNQCGNQIDSKAKFCNRCGCPMTARRQEPVNTGAEAAPVPNGQSANTQQPNNRNKGFRIFLLCDVMVVVLLITVILSVMIFTDNSNPVRRTDGKKIFGIISIDNGDSPKGTTTSNSPWGRMWKNAFSVFAGGDSEDGQNVAQETAVGADGEAGDDRPDGGDDNPDESNPDPKPDDPDPKPDDPEPGPEDPDPKPEDPAPEPDEPDVDWDAYSKRMVEIYTILFAPLKEDSLPFFQYKMYLLTREEKRKAYTGFEKDINAYIDAYKTGRYSAPEGALKNAYKALERYYLTLGNMDMVLNTRQRAYEDTADDGFVPDNRTVCNGDDSRSVTIIYDKYGLVMSYIDDDSDWGKYQWDFTYNAKGQVLSFAESSWNTPDYGYGDCWFDYDAGGQLTYMRRFDIEGYPQKSRDSSGGYNVDGLVSFGNGYYYEQHKLDMYGRTIDMWYGDSMYAQEWHEESMASEPDYSHLFIN